MGSMNIFMKTKDKEKKEKENKEMKIILTDFGSDSSFNAVLS